MLPTRVRAHLVTAGLVTTVCAGAYGMFKAGMLLKKWVNAQPLHQHQEMEDYLYMKERQALRQLQQQQQPKA
ncbi:hypothetical protein PFISCL1PPCAC_17826 [Pristionchus fissidentatus]|uniref:Uncharacterized protein n=1 Tax=Pristionchus fissidentatus TaxID=1538716 RepID=A0AAV5W9K5_9BILA|nr:hypothetical protein PFISCL1PPCAC_17826 [Pristionchus fissidentatus]